MGGLVVRGECSACAACARICPQGALLLEAREEDFRLLFEQRRCDGCGLCLTACLPRCLSPVLGDNGGTGDAVVSLAHGTLHRCRRCRAATAVLVEGRYCPVCARAVGLSVPSAEEQPPTQA